MTKNTIATANTVAKPSRPSTTAPAATSPGAKPPWVLLRRAMVHPLLGQPLEIDRVVLDGPPGGERERDRAGEEDGDPQRATAPTRSRTAARIGDQPPDPSPERRADRAGEDLA